MDVNRDLCDRMRAQAGTETMVRINTNVLRAFLYWGQQHGYLTPLQAELLPRACSMPAPTISRVLERVDTTVALDRARMNGQAEVYIRDEDAIGLALERGLWSRYEWVVVTGGAVHG